MRTADLTKTREDRSRLLCRVAFLACLTLIVIIAAACGDGGGDSEQLFSRADDEIAKLVPESHAFVLKTSASGDDSDVSVDYVASTALAGEPRVHIVSDEDAIRGAERAGEYEGFDVYEQKSSFWAELRGDPPLYVSARDREGLEAYLDFYRSRKPELADERFWDGLEYARGRIADALDKSPSGLLMDFDVDWRQDTDREEIGGLRVEAELGGRRLFVGVLFTVDGEELDDTVAGEFKARFGVPEDADETSNDDWGYPNRIWYADVTGGGQ